MEKAEARCHAEEGRSLLEDIASEMEPSLAQKLIEEWPEGYFDLFGSVDDPTFGRPDEPSKAEDSLREVL